MNTQKFTQKITLQCKNLYNLHQNVHHSVKISVISSNDLSRVITQKIMQTFTQKIIQKITLECKKLCKLHKSVHYSVKICVIICLNKYLL